MGPAEHDWSSVRLSTDTCAWEGGGGGKALQKTVLHELTVANATKLFGDGLRHVGLAGLSSGAVLHLHSIPPSRAEPEAHTARTFSEKTSDTLARLEGFPERVYMHVASLYSMQLRHASSCLRGLRRAGTCRYMRHAVKIPVEMQRGLDILSKTKLCIERMRRLTHLRPHMPALALKSPS